MSGKKFTYEIQVFTGLHHGPIPQSMSHRLLFFRQGFVFQLLARNTEYISISLCHFLCHDFNKKVRGHSTEDIQHHAILPPFIRQRYGPCLKGRR